MPVAARLHVVVRPNARRNDVLPGADGSWCICVAAPPVEGKANRALVAYLADLLGRRPTAIRVTRGVSGRHKIIEVEGMTLDEVTATLSTLPEKEPR